jgi:hypothetical protein
VRAGDAWRQTRKERSGVAGRRTSDRSEDARRVAGRAATTGRVDGEIQEELKRPSDCWYVPVCRVWGDSEKDAQKDAASPEGSDFAAEEGYEEDGPDAEEGYEEVADEVQEALSTMGHEEFDETAEADLCVRSQTSRPSSASSQASVRS